MKLADVIELGLSRLSRNNPDVAIRRASTSYQIRLELANKRFDKRRGYWIGDASSGYRVTWRHLLLATDWEIVA